MGLQAAKEVEDRFLFNSSTTDELTTSVIIIFNCLSECFTFATQRSSTEVTKAGNQKNSQSLINIKTSHAGIKIWWLISCQC